MAKKPKHGRTSEEGSDQVTEQSGKEFIEDQKQENEETQED